MKYRVRMDMSFDAEPDARVLLETGRGLVGKATNVTVAKESSPRSYCELEICRHDEGLPCTLVERVEVAGSEPV